MARRVARRGVRHGPKDGNIWCGVPGSGRDAVTCCVAVSFQTCIACFCGCRTAFSCSALLLAEDVSTKQHRRHHHHHKRRIVEDEEDDEDGVRSDSVDQGWPNVA